MKNKLTDRQKAERYVSKLSPFKKQIGTAILAGFEAQEVAKKLSKENKKPLRTYKAYATMVENGLRKFSVIPARVTKNVTPEPTAENVEFKYNTTTKEISLNELNRQLKKTGFRLSLSLQPLTKKAK